MAARADRQEQSHCWLCRRALGRRIERHHLVPRSRGGRAVVDLHPICHRAIHAHADHARLVKIGADRQALLAIETLARCVAWVAAKPPDFRAPHLSRVAAMTRVACLRGGLA